MKIKVSFIIFIIFFVAVSSCKKDNYQAPSTKLSGRLVYKGEAIGVEQDQVPYELYQYGFGKVGRVGAFGDNNNATTTFAQDGTYSTLLFDGDYKFIVPNGQGPFRWKYTSSGAPDSIAVSVKGDQTLDLEIMPYYMIRTPQITAAGGKVSATFKAEKIITDANAKNIERVSLYINQTQFVSSNGNQRIAATDLATAAITNPDNISLTVTIPTISPTQNYVFARIGLKIAGVEDMIYSPVVKVQY